METMTEDFIRTARAKGAGPRRVLYVHGLRNAIIPIITLIGLSLGTIVSGAVITESVFNYPGMGLLVVNSALREDIPTLLGATFVITIATIAGNLIADIPLRGRGPKRSDMPSPEDLAGAAMQSELGESATRRQPERGQRPVGGTDRRLHRVAVRG